MICQMYLRHEHDEQERVAGDLCPRCHKFNAGDDGDECYHCFAEQAGLEECRLCRREVL